MSPCPITSPRFTARNIFYLFLHLQCPQRQWSVHDLVQRPAVSAKLGARPATLPQPAGGAVAIPLQQLPHTEDTAAAWWWLQRGLGQWRLHKWRFQPSHTQRTSLFSLTGALRGSCHAAASNANAAHQAYTACAGEQYALKIFHSFHRIRVCCTIIFMILPLPPNTLPFQ